MGQIFSFLDIQECVFLLSVCSFDDRVRVDTSVGDGAGLLYCTPWIPWGKGDRGYQRERGPKGPPERVRCKIKKGTRLSQLMTGRIFLGRKDQVESLVHILGPQHEPSLNQWSFDRGK